MAFVRLAFFPDATQEHYDGLAAAMPAHPVPAGRLLFAAGPVEGGWQVVQVWRSREELDAFNQAVLFPAFARMAGRFPVPPEVTDLEPVELVLAP